MTCLSLSSIPKLLTPKMLILSIFDMFAVWKRERARYFNEHFTVVQKWTNTDFELTVSPWSSAAAYLGHQCYQFICWLQRTLISPFLHSLCWHQKDIFEQKKKKGSGQRVLLNVRSMADKSFSIIHLIIEHNLDIMFTQCGSFNWDKTCKKKVLSTKWICTLCE